VAQLTAQEKQEIQDRYFSLIKGVKNGEILKGKIVEVGVKDVIVDVGYKSEGIIPIYEFANAPALQVGEQIEVIVENVEDEEGRISISFNKAQKIKGWKQLSGGYNEGDIVEGRVTKQVKGGYMVEVFGVEGFLPQSLSSFRNMFFRDGEHIVGERFSFQIIKMNRIKQNFILSRRDALKLEREEKRKKVWEEIAIGQLRKGKVKSITNFGAFIDLGGIEGLLHIADMSWKKINHPSEIVAVGDELTVKVLNFDKESGKISLGLKQTMPDPWVDIEKKYPVGTKVNGKIVNMLSYGIFVEVEKGIEGLVHVSEISWMRKNVNVNELFAVGDIVEVKVISVDVEKKKMSLSIRQLEKDPWEEVDGKIAADEVVRGKVIGFGENFGIIELDAGVEGIVYSADLSWTRKINRPQEMLKRGSYHDFKVLRIDDESRMIVLGLKQLKTDPWPEIVEKYPLGSVVDSEVVKVTNFGVFVKLEEELEGLVFSDEIEADVLQSLKPQDRLKVKVIKLDAKNAKIGLSSKIDEIPAPEAA